MDIQQAVQIVQQFVEKREITDEDLIQDFYVIALENREKGGKAEYQRIHRYLTTRYQKSLKEKEEFIPIQSIRVEYDYDMDQEIFEDQLADELMKQVKTLKEREQLVLDLRFGLSIHDVTKDWNSMSMREVGEIIGVCRDRIGQIEAKALRKLRHPGRSKNLKSYLYIDDGFTKNTKTTPISGKRFSSFSNPKDWRKSNIEKTEEPKEFFKESLLDNFGSALFSDIESFGERMLQKYGDKYNVSDKDRVEAKTIFGRRNTTRGEEFKIPTSCSCGFLKNRDGALCPYCHTYCESKEDSLKHQNVVKEMEFFRRPFGATQYSFACGPVEKIKYDINGDVCYYSSGDNLIEMRVDSYNPVSIEQIFFQHELISYTNKITNNNEMIYAKNFLGLKTVEIFIYSMISGNIDKDNYLYFSLDDSKKISVKIYTYGQEYDYGCAPQMLIHYSKLLSEYYDSIPEIEALVQETEENINIKKFKDDKKIFELDIKNEFPFNMYIKSFDRMNNELFSYTSTISNRGIEYGTFISNSALDFQYSSTKENNKVTGYEFTDATSRNKGRFMVLKDNQNNMICRTNNVYPLDSQNKEIINNRVYIRDELGIPRLSGAILRR